MDWYYFGARYYDPEIGRWHSVDPLDHLYPGQSPYNYVNNNPIVNIDPNGQSWYTYTEEYEEEEEYTDEDGNTKTRTVTKTRRRFKWVDDKNDLITTTSDIINNNTTDGQTDWAAVNSAEGSNVYGLLDDGYIVVTGVLQGGAVVGAEGGYINYLDMGGNIHNYGYWAAGLAKSITQLALGVMVGAEIGIIDTEKNPRNLSGLFWGISAFSAVKWGVSASYTSTGFFTDNTVTMGGGIGLGIGFGVQGGYQWYRKSFHFKDLFK